MTENGVKRMSDAGYAKQPAQREMVVCSFLDHQARAILVPTRPPTVRAL
jgi:hypothetical protein